MIDDELESMLGASSVIGKAVQRLRAEHGLDDEAAFERLVDLAEQRGVRLRDAASAVLQAPGPGADSGAA